MLDLEKNGDSPTTCRINAERIKAAYHEHETRLKMVEKTLEDLSQVADDVKDIKKSMADVKDIKESVKDCCGIKPDAQSRAGVTFVFVKDAFIVVFLIVSVGKMDSATITKILTILSGS